MHFNVEFCLHAVFVPSKLETALESDDSYLVMFFHILSVLI